MVEAKRPWSSNSVRAVPGFENTVFAYGVGTLFRGLAHGEHPTKVLPRMRAALVAMATPITPNA